MTDRSPDACEIRRYLLRELPEAERARLEESYFTDDAVLDRVEAEEDQLVADYVMGRLEGTERRRFEDALLGSPYYRERVETTTRLRRRITADRGFRRLLGASASGRTVSHDARLFPGRTGSLVAFALLSTLLIAALVSATRLKGQLEEARRSLRAPEPVLVVLSPRGPEAGPQPLQRLIRPSPAALLIAVPGPAGATSPLKATLVSATGTPAWRGEVRTPAAGGAVFRVPPGVPPPGLYEVRVTSGEELWATLALEIAAPAGR